MYLSDDFPINSFINIALGGNVQLVSLIRIFVRNLLNFLLVPQISVPQPLEYVFMGCGGKLCNYKIRFTPYRI
jgi:hypothetical protein